MKNEFSAMAMQINSLLTDIRFLKEDKLVQTQIRVLDPGDPNGKDCLTITVTADPGTPAEEAASLKAKVEAAYAEFGRCPE